MCWREEASWDPIAKHMPETASAIGTGMRDTLRVLGSPGIARDETAISQ